MIGEKDVLMSLYVRLWLNLWHIFPTEFILILVTVSRQLSFIFALTKKLMQCIVKSLTRPVKAMLAIQPKSVGLAAGCTLLFLEENH
jgi:hypothetical protein